MTHVCAHDSSQKYFLPACTFHLHSTYIYHVHAVLHALSSLHAVLVGVGMEAVKALPCALGSLSTARPTPPLEAMAYSYVHIFIMAGMLVSRLVTNQVMTRVRG